MASTAVDRIIMPFRIMPLVLFLTLMHRPSLGQRDNGQPWQSTRRGRFQAYKHLQSPLAREPVVSCAPPPSPQHNSRDCKSASHGRAEGAFKRSLGNIFPLHEARATGARAIYLDIGARHPFPTKQHPKQTSLPYFTRLYPGGSEFNVYAFEADTFWSQYYTNIENIRERLSVVSLQFLNRAVGVADRIANLTSKPGTPMHSSGTRIIMPPRTAKNGSQSVRKLLVYVPVMEIDFASWLARTVSRFDYVVCKMDIEGAEFNVIPHLISRGVITLIDELFLECHSEEMHGNGPRAFTECIQLHETIRDAGVWEHDWY